jgi:hypothetical protein
MKLSAFGTIIGPKYVRPLPVREWNETDRLHFQHHVDRVARRHGLAGLQVIVSGKDVIIGVPRGYDVQDQGLSDLQSSTADEAVVIWIERPQMRPAPAISNRASHSLSRCGLLDPFSSDLRACHGQPAPRGSPDAVTRAVTSAPAENPTTCKPFDNVSLR